MGERTRGRSFEASARRKVGNDFEDYLQASGARADEDQGPEEWEVFDPVLRTRATRREV
jgi:hypothetical protein